MLFALFTSFVRYWYRTMLPPAKYCTHHSPISRENNGGVKFGLIVMCVFVVSVMCGEFLVIVV
jgi:hypothetical protein